MLDGKLVNVNVDSVVCVLVQVLQFYKVVFLMGMGGFFDVVGEIIFLINLVMDYEDIFVADWVFGGMQLKIDEIKCLLEILLLLSLVLIIKLKVFVSELFIYVGVGMLVCCGECIFVLGSKVELDLEWLDGLVVWVFG